MSDNKIPTLVTPDLVNLYESAGFKPPYSQKTLEAVNRGAPKPCLKDEIKKGLRILDEQDAVNRYLWYNFPSGLTGQFAERLTYYKGQLMLFYDNYTDKWYLLPFALDGDIDFYGRYQRVKPIPIAGPNKDKPINAMSRKVIYDFDDIDENSFTDGCIILRDYTPQYGETIIPRQIINEPILDCMAEAFPLARTSLIANSGVRGMRVTDEPSASNVKAASRSITRAALEGDPLIPIIASVEFQDLTAGKTLQSSEYLQYMQALDNHRLSLYGLKNGGIFEKDSAYVNNIQAGNTQNNVGLVYQDGLTIRQHFCDLANAIWGLGIWCEASETVINSDRNIDGEIADNQDQSGTPNEQPQEVVDEQ